METYKCKNCDGSGKFLLILDKKKKREKMEIHCLLCKGTGEVDWITNIFENRYKISEYPEIEKILVDK